VFGGFGVIDILFKRVALAGVPLGASLRTMPAWRTDAASARKIVGSRMPSATSAPHGAPGSCRLASGGCSSNAVSAPATT
jgi:hypothetical protein